ncbi:DUF2840 domain-containing protein [Oryzicola mucosus]|uniref:DUF2840 domain-containing protein n=1 Tax=Oryzicola mucosus TaxID=2767425 RepID=A0A8J6U070_9HYPH|nr:DUF2840 domain-containing protein [Oryzicola mucosus]MBD0417144.1 DUF2840 domain-containing protein [Oryzicola mucosus]
MTQRNPSQISDTAAASNSDDFITRVELTWVAKKIEHWIRFGRPSCEQLLHRSRKVVGFTPDTIFAFVRWASNDYGTIISRIDIVRAVGRAEVFQTLPFVRPGGEILLRIDGWPKVERVLHLIDAIEVMKLNPVDVAPDYWRHVHNRLTANQEPRAYTIEQHRAWLLRRRTQP